jgi:hypothetical protein
MALLEIDITQLADNRLALKIDPSPVQPGIPVAVIGYPFKDGFRNPLFTDTIFNDIYGVKRAAPGEITGIGTDRLFHDCSTLGGNSGSPVLSMESGGVIGIHYSGEFLYRNEAVDGASLLDFINQHVQEGEP